LRAKKNKFESAKGRMARCDRWISNANHPANERLADIPETIPKMSLMDMQGSHLPENQGGMANFQAMVGSRAPGFALPATRMPSSDRQQVTLNDYLDHWLVLIFYSRDFSLICPTELTAVSRQIHEFQRRNCQVLGISTDSLATHERWITTPRVQGGLGGLNFPLASDEDGAVSRAYGVYGPRQHVAMRGLFIIDPNSVLQYQVVHNLSVGRRTDEVLRVLDALQTGGLCPSDWERENPTLDPTLTLGPNSMLGHYRIEAELGRGSFGAVYRAYDSLLERQVALKVMGGGGSASTDAMLREARAAAALIHPHICTVFAVDAVEGVSMIVMEYLDGQPLSKSLQGGPLSHERAAAIGRQVALGMAAAHAQAIVHGDLKPANIMVTHDGVAKVLDFGLARRQRRAASGDQTILHDDAGTGGLTGTPLYMSPEQVHGQPLMPASDVFSFGLILFEMLTGRTALEGNNILEIMRRIETLDVDRYAGEVAAPFASILRQALVADWRQRGITMTQIAGMLE
jgi:alkyl hydroperoxide reductase subunit AhpC